MSWLVIRVGVDPPHQVVVGSVPVRVLDHRLGLADSRHSPQGLYRDRRARGERRPDLLQLLGAAGEVRVALRHREHCRASAGKLRPCPHRPLTCWEWWRCAGLVPASAGRRDAVQQPLVGLGLRQADQVDADDGGEQVCRPVPAYSHRDQLAVHTVGIGRPGVLPFGAAVHRGLIIRRDHRDRAGRGAYPVVHPVRPVAAGHHVPGLHQHPVSGLFQQPRHPHRPATVRLRVRHEEIPPGRHGALSHTGRFAHPIKVVTTDQHPVAACTAAVPSHWPILNGGPAGSRVGHRPIAKRRPRSGRPLRPSVRRWTMPATVRERRIRVAGAEPRVRLLASSLAALAPPVAPSSVAAAVRPGVAEHGR
jgi:hypothetical protein